MIDANLFELAREPIAAFFPIAAAFMPALIGAAGSVASAGIGAISAGKQSRDAKKLAREQMIYQSPAAIRDRALAGGFNPLTVLTNGGLQQTMPTPVPTLSSLDVIANAVGNLSNQLASIDPVAMETQQLENDLLREQIDAIRKKNADPAGKVGQMVNSAKVPALRVYPQSPTVTRQPTLGPLTAGAPLPRPGPEPFDFPLYTEDGTSVWVPKSWARAHDLEPWDTLYPGLRAELLGELIGEGTNTLAATVVVEKMRLGPMYGEPTKPVKTDRRGRPQEEWPGAPRPSKDYTPSTRRNPRRGSTHLN